MLIIEMLFFRNAFYGENGVMKYIAIFIFVFILGFIIFLIRRIFFTKPSITLESDHVISTKLQKYDASQIECIYMNYRRIGFKRYGKRIVPMDLCFYFKRDQETAGVEAVREWAARNNKEIKHKFFQTLA
ncbi:hypothetical protein EC604_16400 [Paenibacillus amylolyticus]|jgi:hypothetical protein|uniref:Uncharacterized protein n=2 Tax=Paenibacillus TaxID=44249 RepID=A0A5M9WUW0_PAEAM|nr:hypothetical protein EC604_16400 [Paenibacillus amylolyticus]